MSAVLTWCPHDENRLASSGSKIQSWSLGMGIVATRLGSRGDAAGIPLGWKNQIGIWEAIAIIIRPERLCNESCWKLAFGARSEEQLPPESIFLLDAFSRC
jgi:hypothetical protein